MKIRLIYLLESSLALLVLFSCPANAKSFIAASTNSPEELRALAFKNSLENHHDLALDYYQKAVEKAIKEYGANSSYTGNLYFEMGTLASNMAKFTLAEHCLSRAVEINPHSVVARLKLADLLRLREKSTSALQEIQRSTEEKSRSPQARQQLVAYLQESNPAAAIQQAYWLHQILSGATAPSANVIPKAKSTEVAPEETQAVVTPATTNKPENKQENKPTNTKAKATQTKKEATSTKQADKKQKAAEAPKKPKRHTQKSNPVAQQSKESPIQAEDNPSTEDTSTEEATSNLTQLQPVKKKASKPSHTTPRGLVPPPPPMMPALQGAIPRLDPNTQAIQLKTNAQLKKGKNKIKKDSQASTPESAAPASSSEDPDFLIEWASVKKKSAK